MAWTPIAGLPPQIQKADGTLASGYYLKFYSDTTTTAIFMATDSTGSTLLDKCQINSSGYPINGSSAPFVPHISESYRIAIYLNATDADNDTIGNADLDVDLLLQFQTGASDLWNIFTGTPTQTSATTFTLTGDQTSTFAVGTRCKFTDASTLYGIVTASAFTTLTTVTVVLDSGSLSGSLTEVFTSKAETTDKPISTGTIVHNTQDTNGVNNSLSDILDTVFYAENYTGVDDDETISNVLTAVKANGGGTVELQSNKDYTITEAITDLINDEGGNIENIVIKGNWARLHASGFNGTILQIGKSTSTNRRCERIVIENLRMEGSGDGSSDTSQTAIAIWSALGITLRSVYIQNMGGDAIVIDKPPLGGNGNAFSNGIVLDDVRTRFSGRRSLVVGESVVTDDITIIGNCMFNNGGSSITSNGAGDTGMVHIETQTLMWYGGEVSGSGSDNKTNGYVNAVYLQSCAGNMSGVHFELDGPAIGGAYSLLIDNACHGLNVSGLEINESGGFAFVDADVNTSTDEITESSHGLITSQAVRLVTSGTLPTGLSTATTYYVIKVDDNKFQLATSEANADAGTQIDITAASGGGNHHVKTDFPNGIRCTADFVYIGGLQFVGSRVPEILVNINDSEGCMIGPIHYDTWTLVQSGDYPEPTVVNSNDDSRSAFRCERGYVTLPEMIPGATSGKLVKTGGNMGNFTLAANSSTTVSNDQVTSNTHVVLTPTNAAAALLQSGTKHLYLSGRNNGTSFTLTTQDGTAAAGTETFDYIMVS